LTFAQIHHIALIACIFYAIGALLLQWLLRYSASLDLGYRVEVVNRIAFGGWHSTQQNNPYHVLAADTLAAVLLSLSGFIPFVNIVVALAFTVVMLHQCVKQLTQEY